MRVPIVEEYTGVELVEMAIKTIASLHTKLSALNIATYTQFYVFKREWMERNWTIDEKKTHEK